LDEESLTSADEKRAALTRVLESTAFRRSPRLREFLEFVTTRTLDGHGGEISEQHLGAVVFQRGPGFSPAEDNIVRATARALRAKLREYYDAEGADDPLRIDLPKGRYTPEFHPAPGGRNTAPATRPDLMATRPATWQNWAIASLLLVLCALCASLWLENRRLRESGTSPIAIAESSSLLAELLPSECSVTIVASDAFHTHLQSFRGSVSSLEEFSSRSVFAIPPPALSHSPDLWDLIRTQPLTHGDDVRAAVQLARSMSPSCDVKLAHARSVTMHTFQRGGDFLLLAGRRANPWAGLFEKDLQFQMVFPNATDSAVFVNSRPRAGERTEYRTVLDSSQTGVAYGRVAVVPGLYGSGRVILVAGTSGETTFAATDFLTQPLGLQRLQEQLRQPVNDKIRKMEVLIETSAIGGGTKDFQIVAVR
jgi:hypothetical protein